MGRLIIDGNRVYELDEACLQKKKGVKKPQMTREENKKPKRRN